MKYNKFAFEVIQTLLFCLMLACSSTVMAADNSMNNESGHQLVDINTADAATIAATMEGVGMVKAQAIVAFREMVGKFQSLDQLLEVRGIGPETLEKNRHRLTVSTE